MHEDIVSATPPLRPSHLAASYLRVAHTHLDNIKHTLSSLHYQCEAVRIASSSLELNILTFTDVFEGVAGAARAELEKQATLLAGLEADLSIISKVKIHRDFMTPSARTAIEAGERSGTLGDYVSNMKMRQVAETCKRTHGSYTSLISSQCI